MIYKDGPEGEGETGGTGGDLLCRLEPGHGSGAVALRTRDGTSGCWEKRKERERENKRGKKQNRKTVDVAHARIHARRRHCRRRLPRVIPSDD